MTARRTLCIPAAVLLLAALVPAGADVLRTAPRTGIYVEAEYLHEAPGCDWYYPAAELIGLAPPPDAGECAVVIRIRGTLNRDGARLFAEVSDALLAWPVVPTRIVLNSQGGDSQAAFYMAGIIRAHALYRRVKPGVMTAIDESPNAVCFSACIIVFAAGFERHALFDEYGDPSLPSRLGIHRPGQYDSRRLRYDTSSDNRSIRAVRRQLEQYFESVGVSSALVDAMFAVPFDDIHLLSEREARDYGLLPERP